jgi:hypothetical protein
MINGACPQYEEAFAEIATGFTQLITDTRRPFPHHHWIKLYDHIFKICSNPHEPRPHDLYKDIKALLTRHCRNVLSNLQRLHAASLLRAYMEAHESFFTGMQYISQIAAYLSRWWVKRQLAFGDGEGGVFSLELLPYVLWQDELLLHLHPALFEAIMGLVNERRTVERAPAADTTTEYGLLRDVVGTFRTLDSRVAPSLQTEQLVELPGTPADQLEARWSRRAYATFEKRFLQQTLSYYTVVGQRLVSEEGVCEYMTAAERLLKGELERAKQWLPAPTLAKCCDCCFRALVQMHIDTLTGCLPNLFRRDWSAPGRGRLSRS